MFYPVEKVMHSPWLWDWGTMAVRGEGRSMFIERPHSRHFKLHRQNESSKNRSDIQTKPYAQSRCSLPNSDVEGGLSPAVLNVTTGSFGHFTKLGHTLPIVTMCEYE